MIFKNLFNKNADQLAKVAISNYQQGKDEFKVIEKLQKAIKIGINHYPLDQIYLYIGAAYSDLAIYDKAKEAYEKGLEYNSKNSSLLSNLGIALNELGNIEESIIYYKASLKIDPNNSYALNNIGLYLYENGEHFEAIEKFNKAIKINPALNVAYALRSRSLAYLGKYKEASSSLKKAIIKGYDNGKVLKSELEDIKAENPLIFTNNKKFNELLSLMKINSKHLKVIMDVQNNPFEFYKNNTNLFENKELTSFEINCILHWNFLIQVLNKESKILIIDELFESDQILDKIKNLLLSNNFEVNNSLNEFENFNESDSEELLYLIASKLNISHSIELINIWTPDNELNIYPIDKNKWKSLKYPFIDSEYGYGKISPLATNTKIEQYLTNIL